MLSSAVRSALFFPSFRLSFSAEIADREIEIVHDLGQEILKYEDLLSTTSDICAELDW